MTRDYIEGYQQCTEDFERALNESITKHKGATTLIDAYHVLSEMIYYTHKQHERIHSEQTVQPTIILFGGI